MFLFIASQARNHISLVVPTTSEISHRICEISQVIHTGGGCGTHGLPGQLRLWFNVRNMTDTILSWRPFVKRFALCYRPVCLSCLSVCVCLETLVYCGQKVERIKMPLGMEVDFGLGNIVLDGDSAPLPAKGTWAENWGLCPFVGGAGSPSNTMSPGR